MELSAVPVLYYHSVKYKRKYNWVHPQVTLELKNFYRHLKFFKSLKFSTHHFDDLYLHLSGNRKLKLKSILLTFDDGYLDNYTFVFPLLKKYKLKATFWINPDFIDNNDLRIRPTLEDYWDNKISLDELNDADGFVNWEEMKVMEKSGYVDIQSHTYTHARYPVSDKIIDFVNPSTKIDWLYWNLYPDDKSFFLTEPHYKIPLGHPVYESQKGNIALKYEEDGELTSQLIKFVAQKGGEKFFNASDWKNELFDLAEKIKKNDNIHYKRETDTEYINRIRYELSESKSIIEKKLNKEVNYVCWPYGGWNETTIKLSDDCGYILNTAKGQKNIFRKEKSNRVDRFSLDNSKYQNYLFGCYGAFKLLEYKIK